jgi:hypothetical protein
MLGERTRLLASNAYRSNYCPVESENLLQLEGDADRHRAVVENATLQYDPSALIAEPSTLGTTDVCIQFNPFGSDLIDAVGSHPLVQKSIRSISRLQYQRPRPYQPPPPSSRMRSTMMRSVVVSMCVFLGMLRIAQPGILTFLITFSRSSGSRNPRGEMAQVMTPALRCSSTRMGAKNYRRNCTAPASASQSGRQKTFSYISQKCPPMTGFCDSIVR